jgi:hypothetical protein
MGPGIIRQPRLSARRYRGACALLAASFAALASSHAAAQAVDGDTATARIQTVIQTPGSIDKTADMNFGSIAQSSNAGTVVLTPANSATCTTTGGLIRTGVCRAARFSIYGRRNWKVRIRETNGGVVTLNGPAGATMTMNAITMSYTDLTPVNGANGWNLGRYNIDNNTGIAEIWLGGTLNVGVAQTPGVYTGTVVIQIQFN